MEKNNNSVISVQRAYRKKFAYKKTPAAVTIIKGYEIWEKYNLFPSLKITVLLALFFEFY